MENYIQISQPHPKENGFSASASASASIATNVESAKFDINDLIIKMLNILQVNITNIDDISKITIDFETFKDNGYIDQLYELIPIFKKKYKSNMLTCLHKNSISKQTFPAINFVRQILKCNNLKLKGYYLPLGNEAFSSKKILKRVYKIIPLQSVSSASPSASPDTEGSIVTNPA